MTDAMNLNKVRKLLKYIGQDSAEKMSVDFHHDEERVVSEFCAATALWKKDYQWQGMQVDDGPLDSDQAYGLDKKIGKLQGVKIMHRLLEQKGVRGDPNICYRETVKVALGQQKGANPTDFSLMVQLTYPNINYVRSNMIDKNIELYVFIPNPNDATIPMIVEFIKVNKLDGLVDHVEPAYLRGILSQKLEQLQRQDTNTEREQQHKIAQEEYLKDMAEYEKQRADIAYKSGVSTKLRALHKLQEVFSSSLPSVASLASSSSSSLGAISVSQEDFPLSEPLLPTLELEEPAGPVAISLTSMNEVEHLIYSHLSLREVFNPPMSSSPTDKKQFYRDFLVEDITFLKENGERYRVKQGKTEEDKKQEALDEEEQKKTNVEQGLDFLLSGFAEEDISSFKDYIYRNAHQGGFLAGGNSLLVKSRPNVEENLSLPMRTRTCFFQVARDLHGKNCILFTETIETGPASSISVVSPTSPPIPIGDAMDRSAAAISVTSILSIGDDGKVKQDLLEMKIIPYDRATCQKIFPNMYVPSQDVFLEPALDDSRSPSLESSSISNSSSSSSSSARTRDEEALMMQQSLSIRGSSVHRSLSTSSMEPLTSMGTAATSSPSMQQARELAGTYTTDKMVLSGNPLFKKLKSGYHKKGDELVTQEMDEGSSAIKFKFVKDQHSALAPSSTDRTISISQGDITISGHVLSPAQTPGLSTLASATHLASGEKSIELTFNVEPTDTLATIEQKIDLIDMVKTMIQQANVQPSQETKSSRWGMSSFVSGKDPSKTHKEKGKKDPNVDKPNP